uniref:Immunoglobulin domain-containing protein n=1 Tax=Gopherus agassizii TaxID=38772 RepID=A0A452I9P1_9SAUR
MHLFALFCFSGYFHRLAALELTGPGAVSGLWGRSVSVPCQYHERYQETPKYWCSGIIWQSCSKVVETTGSEAEVKRDTVSIRDNHTLHMFTVTLENLTLGDTGIYWCGINLRSKSDFNFPVSVTVLQGESLLPSLCGTAEPTCSSR